MGKGKLWTTEQIQMLKDNASLMDEIELSKLIGKSIMAVIVKKQRLGIKRELCVANADTAGQKVWPNYRYTAAEDAIIASNDDKTAARLLGRTKTAIEQRRYRLRKAPNNLIPTHGELLNAGRAKKRLIWKSL